MKTVLIADDDPSLRLLIRSALEAVAYQVLEAADGQEAWTLIRGGHPDLVIIDWMLPVYTGLELAAVIKGDPQLARTPVIMLSIRSQEADVQQGEEAGVDAYITKPISLFKLLETVEQTFSVA